jgi:hypothetical protein
MGWEFFGFLACARPGMAFADLAPRSATPPSRLDDGEVPGSPLDAGLRIRTGEHGNSAS